METLHNTFRPLPSSDYVLFQLFTRDVDDRMRLNTFVDYDLAMEAKNNPDVESWQLRRWDGKAQRMVMQAVSTNWFTLKPVIVMQKREAQSSEVIDGLLVEQQGSNTYIYFRPNPRPSESCIRVFNGHSMTIMGDVQAEQYAGFLQAVALAPRYMRATP